MEETGKAGKKSNIEINADKGAKQNSHPGREEWPHLIRIGVMVFVTFAVSILFFFALYRFEKLWCIWTDRCRQHAYYNGTCACIPDESCHAVAGKML